MGERTKRKKGLKEGDASNNIATEKEERKMKGEMSCICAL